MNEEIMNVTETENEEVVALVPAEEGSCEECDSGSVLGTIVKVGGGILIGYVASKVIRQAKPKFQELKEKHAERKAAKAEAKRRKNEVEEFLDAECIEEE